MLTKVLAYVMAGAMIAGCTSVTSARGPDGEDAFIIRGLSSEACYEKAAEICGGEYVLRSTALAPRDTGGGTEIFVSCK